MRLRGKEKRGEGRAYEEERDFGNRLRAGEEGKTEVEREKKKKKRKKIMTKNK